MLNSGSGYSLSDIAAATRNGDGAFGDGNSAWWIIILFLFAFVGYGNDRGGIFGGGFGSGGNIGTNYDGYILTSDFASLERKIDGVNNGLCDGFYAMNTGMLNGFAGVNSAIQADTVANMQNTNAIQAQLNAMAATTASSFCATQREIEKGFSDTNYNMATNTRDIIANQDANTRSILDFLTQDKIATLTAENQSLKFAASQAAQNAYLTSELKPCPIPAYVVANPYCNCGQAFNGCACVNY